MYTFERIPYHRRGPRSPNGFGAIEGWHELMPRNGIQRHIGSVIWCSLWLQRVFEGIWSEDGPGQSLLSHLLNEDRMEVIFNRLDSSGCAWRRNPGARSTIRVGV
jgi:hypothetical protein